MRLRDKISYFIGLVVETPNYWLIIILQGISGLMNFVGFPLIIPLLEYLRPGGGGDQAQSSFGFLAPVIQALGIGNNFYLLLFVASLLILSGQLLVTLSNLIAVWAQVRLSKEYRKKLLRDYSSADWYWLANHHSSEINHAVIIEADYASVAHLNAQRVVIYLLQSIFYLALAIKISFFGTLLALAVFAILGVVNVMNSRVVGRLNRAYNDELRLVSNLSTGLQQNKKFFKTSNLAERFVKKIMDGVDRIVGLTKRINLRQQLQTGWSFAFSFIFLISLVVFHHQLSIDFNNLVLIVLVLNRLAPQFTSLSDYYLAMNSYIPMHTSLNERLSDMKQHAEVYGNQAYKTSKTIKFVNVVFAYPDGKWKLSGVDLEIAIGKTTAIVGGSGAGKSTILDLILGLLKPASGSILYGDIIHGDLDFSSFRKQVAYVNQTPTLLDGTLKENLLIANPSAEDALIESVCRKAQLSSFIESLPDGLGARIGENGVKLSGGQRQRIVLARSLLLNPEILILDEATSELDMETEMLIQETIAELSKELTIIIVAHRLSTVRNADRIYVMEKGRVCETGTYKELLEKKGRLYYLDSLQKVDMK